MQSIQSAKTQSPKSITSDIEMIKDDYVQENLIINFTSLRWNS